MCVCVGQCLCVWVCLCLCLWLWLWQCLFLSLRLCLGVGVPWVCVLSVSVSGCWHATGMCLCLCLCLDVCVCVRACCPRSCFKESHAPAHLIFFISQEDGGGVTELRPTKASSTLHLHCSLMDPCGTAGASCHSHPHLISCYVIPSGIAKGQTISRRIISSRFCFVCFSFGLAYRYQYFISSSAFISLSLGRSVSKKRLARPVGTDTLCARRLWRCTFVHPELRTCGRSVELLHLCRHVCQQKE